MFVFEKSAVLHVALNPVTGPWSVMRDLAQAQAVSGNYQAVGIGVITSKHWPVAYAEELQATGLRHYRSATMQTFGTAQFVWQRFFRPPIDQWVKDLRQVSGAQKCVIHFHNAWMSGVFLPSECVRRGQAAAVATFHGMNAQLEGRPVRRWLHRWMASRLPRYQAQVTSVDRANLELAEVVLGLNPRTFTTIPNGVPDIVGLRCDTWTGTGEFRVGHVGSITERKGWRIAADAVLQLRSAGLNVRLLIAGAGPEEGQARILAQQNPEALEFLGHVVQPRQHLMPRLHALTVMSVHEGLPMSLVEAMSVGLPVVATAVGGIPEAITHEQNGFLVARNADALVVTLRRLYDSPEIWERVNRAARAQFEHRFEIQRIVAQYEAVYQRALN